MLAITILGPGFVWCRQENRLDGKHHMNESQEIGYMECAKG